MKKFVALDFEFNGVSEPNLNLVSVVAKAYDNGALTFERKFWLHQSPRTREQARKFF